MIYVACHGAGRVWLQPTAMFKGTWAGAGGTQVGCCGSHLLWCKGRGVE